MSDVAAIETSGLTKQYREVRAVDALSLRVHAGEIYGFLGRNGAGKTTTIRMILGLVHPTAGEVRVFGTPVSSDRPGAVRNVGSLVETATAYPNLTVRENLEIQRALCASPRESVDRAISLLGLAEYAVRRAGRLSLGNKQRLALARAVLPRPRLLVLDEPANALDPAGIVEIRTLLQELARSEGVTIFVSSHILGEVAQLVDRIGIIHRGRLVEELALRSVAGQRRGPVEGPGGVAPQVVEIVLARGRERGAGADVKVEADARVGADAKVGADARVGVGAALEVLGRLQGLGTVRPGADGESLSVACGAVEPQTVLRRLIESGIDVRIFRPVHDDLEARFLRLTGEEA